MTLASKQKAISVFQAGVHQSFHRAQTRSTGEKKKDPKQCRTGIHDAARLAEATALLNVYTQSLLRSALCRRRWLWARPRPEMPNEESNTIMPGHFHWSAPIQSRKWSSWNKAPRTRIEFRSTQFGVDSQSAPQTVLARMTGDAVVSELLTQFNTLQRITAPVGERLSGPEGVRETKCNEAVDLERQCCSTSCSPRGTSMVGVHVIPRMNLSDKSNAASDIRRRAMRT